MKKKYIAKRFSPYRGKDQIHKNQQDQLSNKSPALRFYFNKLFQNIAESSTFGAVDNSGKKNFKSQKGERQNIFP